MSNKKDKKSNKVCRYRLNDYTANKLGCELNKSKRYRLSKLQETQLLALAPQKIKRLFFDIETSPNVVYSWRIGYNLNLNPTDIIKERAIISICYKWEDEDKVYELTWDENQCDKQMLIDFVPVLHNADEIVAHNGKRFDEKWIRTRCIFHGVRTFPKYKSLDTLTKSRGGFNFNSNKLDYIAKFLNVGAKMQHSGFQMWKDIIELKDPDAMKMMVEYNKVDVVVLEDVFHALQPYINPETHVGVVNNSVKYSCPNCGSEATHLFKNEFTAKGTISRKMECEGCGTYHNITNSAYKLFIETNFNSNL